MRGAGRVITAQVPLSEMFGYATDIRSKTQGRATYTMQFAHYEEVPKTISEQIIAKVKGETVKNSSNTNSLYFFLGGGGTWQRRNLSVPSRT